MTRKQGEEGDQIKTIGQIKSEYENLRQKNTEVTDSRPSSPKAIKGRIGDIWFNCVSNEYFICNGRINGEANWVKLLDVLEP